MVSPSTITIVNKLILAVNSIKTNLLINYRDTLVTGILDVSLGERVVVEDRVSLYGSLTVGLEVSMSLVSRSLVGELEIGAVFGSSVVALLVGEETTVIEPVLVFLSGALITDMTPELSPVLPEPSPEPPMVSSTFTVALAVLPS